MYHPGGVFPPSEAVPQAVSSRKSAERMNRVTNFFMVVISFQVYLID